MPLTRPQVGSYDSANFSYEPSCVLDVAEHEHGLVPGADEEIRRRLLPALEPLAVPVVEGIAVRIAGDVPGRRDSRPGDVRLGDDERRGAARGARSSEEQGQPENGCRRDDYSKRHGSPEANDFRIRRATTMRCTSSGPS